MPGMNLDLTLDFTSDVDYDFYTRDRNAPAACGYLSYQTWNHELNRPTYVNGGGDWWQRPTPVPPLIGNGLGVPVDHAVSLQPPVAPPTPLPLDYDEIYRNKWNSHAYGK